MTTREKNEFKKWNIDITVNKEKQNELANKIEYKYLKLNGRRSCNPETFIFEIATTEAIDQKERIRDMRDYIEYLKARAKSRALSDILHIYH